MKTLTITAVILALWRCLRMPGPWRPGGEQKKPTTKSW